MNQPPDKRNLLRQRFSQLMTPELILIMNDIAIEDGLSGLPTSILSAVNRLIYGSFNNPQMNSLITQMDALGNQFNQTNGMIKPQQPINPNPTPTPSDANIIHPTQEDDKNIADFLDRVTSGEEEDVDLKDNIIDMFLNMRKQMGDEDTDKEKGEKKK